MNRLPEEWSAEEWLQEADLRVSEDDLWIATLIAPAPASTTCPHVDAASAHYSTADDTFRCPACLEDDPPPPHGACDRCHVELENSVWCAFTLGTCRVAIALCNQCAALLEPRRDTT